MIATGYTISEKTGFGTFCEAYRVYPRRHQWYIQHTKEKHNIDTFCQAVLIPQLNKECLCETNSAKAVFQMALRIYVVCLLHLLLYQPLHSPNNQLHPSAVWTLCHQFPEKWQMLWWTACQLVSKLDNTWRSEVFVTTSPLPHLVCVCVCVCLVHMQVYTV